MPVQLEEQSATPRRILLLGAAGFLARDVATCLAQAGLNGVAIGSAQVDLTRPESVPQLQEAIRPDDSLVMLSALTPEKGRDASTFTKNILMMTHLCSALDQRPCRHVVYVSSDAVYADQDPLMTEDTPACPKGLYALMHAAREAMLENTAAHAGIPLCVVRPCAIYGSGDTHNSYGPNRFIRSAQAVGKIVLFGGGEEQRDHIYVRDVSEFLRLCLLHAVQGVLNITTGTAFSFLDVAQMIMRLSPRTVAIEHLPRSTAITHRRFDAALRRKLFPAFEPRPLENGLKMMIRDIFEQEN